MQSLPRTVAAVLTTCMALGLTLVPQSAGAAPGPRGVDKTILKTNLPEAKAFLDGEPADLSAAVAFCNSGPSACSFTVELENSFAYYDRAQVVGDTFINCTRNLVENNRPVSYEGVTYDSVNKAQPDLFAHPDLDRPQEASAMSEQFAAAAERALTLPWTWTTSVSRTVTERVQPGEASWIEAQTARQRVYGSFTAAGQGVPAWRIEVIVDSPSRALPDRLLQRTAPMSTVEQQRCVSSRPSALMP
ncbi:hypothetical protein ACODT5_07405 [Streptomyces sp. 5.8]|uniref:hypothetical protein n=1 Tax=Streptomyces sp. 5.8 TaxID=3406571 RepID=UPI003BB53256